jgi:putative toxin-antitoxin system antitoxin component (TIGR02293 family)
MSTRSESITQHHEEATTPDIAKFLEFLRSGGPGPHSHVVLLGLDTFDSAELLRSIQRGFRYRTFERFTRNLSLSFESVTKLIDVPRRTLTRRKQEGRFLPEESDRLLRASRLFGKALELFDGDREATTHWLTTPQVGLAGAVPIELARTELGAREIETLIERLEHGVFP